jgi:hypothetical protein
MRATLPDLSRQMRDCQLCCDRLPLLPRPVFQIDQRTNSDEPYRDPAVAADLYPELMML